jgi:hypothetical protein
MLLKPRFPKPASLKVHTRFAPLRPELAEIKCGLPCANATDGAAIMANASNAVAAVAVVAVIV